MTAVGGPLVVAACTEFTSLILLRFVEERRRGLAPREAVDVAASRTGRAFIVSALTAIAGVAVIATSSLPLLRDFGLIVALNVADRAPERAGRAAADARVGRQAQLGARAGCSASSRSRSSPRHRWGRAPPRQPVPPPRPDLRWLPRTTRRGSGTMANETVIKGGTVYDGTGAPGVRADVAHRRRPHHRDRSEPRRRSRARRRRLRRRARLHRHPHALRRAGVLGPRAHAVVLPRRHHRRRRQLRVLDRADPRRAPRAHRPHARERRGHGRRRARGRHPVGLRHLPRVPRLGARATASASTSPRTSATPRCGST